MGYTNYWYSKEIGKEAFNKIATDVAVFVSVLEKAGIKLSSGDGKGAPIITPELISINGSDDCGHDKENIGLAWPSDDASGVSDGNSAVSGSWFAGTLLNSRQCNGSCSYESFIFRLKSSQFYEFNSCKTNYKPYDLAITGILLIAKHHLGDEILLSSDGEIKGFSDAGQIISKLFKYDLVLDLEADKKLLELNKGEKALFDAKEAESKEKERDGYTQSEKRYLGSKEIAKRVREELKKFKGFKFSITSGVKELSISVMESPIKLILSFEEISEDTLERLEHRNNYKKEQIKELQKRDHHQLGRFNSDYDCDSWSNGVFLTEKGHNVLKEIYEIAQKYNYDNSDLQTDYFDVNFYLNMNLGKWDKKFIDGVKE